MEYWVISACDALSSVQSRRQADNVLGGLRNRPRHKHSMNTYHGCASIHSAKDTLTSNGNVDFPYISCSLVRASSFRVINRFQSAIFQSSERFLYIRMRKSFIEICDVNRQFPGLWASPFSKKPAGRKLSSADKYFQRARSKPLYD